ncbi:MAG: hypothetical protein WC445_01095 [Patescibacteria group bacterium]
MPNTKIAEPMDINKPEAMPAKIYVIITSEKGEVVFPKGQGVQIIKGYSLEDAFATIRKERPGTRDVTFVASLLLDDFQKSLEI